MDEQFANVDQMQAEITALETSAGSPDHGVTGVAGPGGSIQDAVHGVTGDGPALATAAGELRQDRPGPELAGRGLRQGRGRIARPRRRPRLRRFDRGREHGHGVTAGTTTGKVNKLIAEAARTAAAEAATGIDLLGQARIEARTGELCPVDGRRAHQVHQEDPRLGDTGEEESDDQVRDELDS
ncbi:MAG TPA: hypothetical protein VJT49_02995 [Amycolatopsis sp.]|uniref:hypothetical protein n=1 Tax=Amycolatopsis sp. TaxID=37632 RepID=UPI002B492910|nr:hypothetical protein [Amycolatopsis sp.]HKS44082.1 hypothetical protein [Amycolatopsis sp.]